MTSTDARQPLTRSTLIDSVARVDLRVRDIPTAVAFYTKVVGLETVDVEDRHATLRSPGGPVVLHLDSEGVTEPADPRATGLFHTAFRFPTRPALGQALERVIRAELEVGAGDHLVSEALYIDDPDGNGVELYWDRPVEEWPAPSGDALIPMATLPVDLEDLYEARNDDAGETEQAPPGTDVGHVHLQVSDIGETSRFYVEILGLDLTARIAGSAAFLSSKGYHHNIGTNTWRSLGGKPATDDRAGLQRVVFGVSEAGELEQLAERLDVESWDATTTDGVVTLLDPSGIELQFRLLPAAS